MQKQFDISIIQTYAPTITHSDEKTEAYYEEITMILQEVKSPDVLIVMGYLNAKVGKGTYQNLALDQESKNHPILVKNYFPKAIKSYKNALKVHVFALFL